MVANAFKTDDSFGRSCCSLCSSGSGEANDTNAANNPAHPLLTVDLWNYFAPSPEGFPGRIGNQGLLRLAVPIDAFGMSPRQGTTTTRFGDPLGFVQRTWYFTRSDTMRRATSKLAPELGISLVVNQTTLQLGMDCMNSRVLGL
jgi:hypothetical protein